jgi:hypothetical protein
LRSLGRGAGTIGSGGAVVVPDLATAMATAAAGRASELVGVRTQRGARLETGGRAFLSGLRPDHGKACRATTTRAGSRTA